MENETSVMDEQVGSNRRPRHSSAERSKSLLKMARSDVNLRPVISPVARAPRIPSQNKKRKRDLVSSGLLGLAGHKCKGAGADRRRRRRRH